MKTFGKKPLAEEKWSEKAKQMAPRATLSSLEETTEMSGCVCGRVATKKNKLKTMRKHSYFLNILLRK